MLPPGVTSAELRGLLSCPLWSASPCRNDPGEGTLPAAVHGKSRMRKPLQGRKAMPTEFPGF